MNFALTALTVTKNSNKCYLLQQIKSISFLLLDTEVDSIMLLRYAYLFEF